MQKKSLLVSYTIILFSSVFLCVLGEAIASGSSPTIYSLKPSLRGEAVLRILALRAEFQSDTLATTTGDGRFDLSTSSTYRLDRPPHDCSYFQQQLLALANYFQRVSRGKVKLQADVFPIEENRVYVLPHDMIYYSGQLDETRQKQGWAELLRDALQAAVNQGGIDFSLYQCIMVFHAGVGQDFAFDVDTSPYDIQSVLIDFTTLKQGLAPDVSDYKGIELPGNIYVREGLILPETQNQEDLELGLLGSMTLLMGSHLGMPSLFDTKTGRAGIGRWGLMDQGSANFQGFIPAEPSAWEKVYMGWDVPLEVRNGEKIRIGASSTKSAPHIFKIPITSKEYFLIENRQRDPNHDKVTIGRDANGKKAEFDSTGRVVASADIGVLTRIDEYDYGLPGSGILIWHIDERLIEAGLQDNTVNNNRDFRGVDLVECDGAQDIGYIYSLFDAAYGTENGDFWDAYWRSNESHKVVNNTKEVVFSPTSIPNSNSYDGGNTHLSFDHFSENDTIMTLDIHAELIQAGFPRRTERKFADGALLAISAEGNRPGLLLAPSSDSTNIFAWAANGDPILPGGQPIIHYSSTTVSYPPVVADLDLDGINDLTIVDDSSTVSFYSLRPQQQGGDTARIESRGSFTKADRRKGQPIIIAAANSNDYPYVVIATDKGYCDFYRYSASPNNAIVPLTELHLSNQPLSGIASASSSSGVDFVVTSLDANIYGCSMTPSIVWQKSLSSETGKSQPLVADFDGRPGLEIAVVFENGAMNCFTMDGVELLRYRPPLTLHGVTAPSLGDIDDDGLPEILCNSREGFIALEFTGAITLNFPVPIAAVGTTDLIPGALWRSNLDGSGALAVVAGQDGLVHAFDGSGKEVTGFPLSAGEPIGTTPAMADLDGDDRMELAVISQDGFLYVWKMFWPAALQNDWTQYGGGVTHNFCRLQASQPVASTDDWMPAKKVFCYPNPAEDGNTNIRFSLFKPAESVFVHFYDLAGNGAGKIQAVNLSAGDHELVWNISNIESGVYIARVEARAEGESKVQMIKIAVVK